MDIRVRATELVGEERAEYNMMKLKAFAYECGMRDFWFLNQAIDAYSAFQCLPIAFKFYERELPREIRDMVYLRLIGFGTLRETPSLHCLSNPTFYAVNPEFVGEEMAREVAKLRLNDSDPRAALWLDRFNPNVRPCDPLRRLTIDLEFEPAKWFPQPHSTSQEYLTRKYTDLATLSSAILPEIKRLDRLSFTIRLETDIDVRNGYDLLEEKEMIYITEIL